MSIDMDCFHLIKIKKTGLESLKSVAASTYFDPPLPSDHLEKIYFKKS